jgi:hypothetical protein
MLKYRYKTRTKEEVMKTLIRLKYVLLSLLFIFVTGSGCEEARNVNFHTLGFESTDPTRQVPVELVCDSEVMGEYVPSYSFKSSDVSELSPCQLVNKPLCDCIVRLDAGGDYYETFIANTGCISIGDYCSSDATLQYWRDDSLYIVCVDQCGDDIFDLQLL